MSHNYTVPNLNQGNTNPTFVRGKGVMDGPGKVPGLTSPCG
jgi:hypothetical protein